MKKLNILVIGGTGFLGSCLVSRLLKEGSAVKVFSRGNSKSIQTHVNVEYIEGDIIKNDKLNSLFNKIDYVYYFASTTNPKSSENDLIFDLSSNLIPFISILNKCVENNIKKFIFCSSGGTVYGNSNKIPLSENSLCKPISSYGLVKLNMEFYIKYFNRKYNLSYDILRLSNPYGVNNSSKSLSGIIPTYIKNIISDNEIKVYGNGEIVRDYIYIEDFIDLNLKLLNTKEKNNIMNVGSGNGISILELIKKIESVVGKKARIEYLPKRDFDVDKNVLKITKARDIYGWEPKISLNEGIKRTLHWIKGLK